MVIEIAHIGHMIRFIYGTCTASFAKASEGQESAGHPSVGGFFDPIANKLLYQKRLPYRGAGPIGNRDWGVFFTRMRRPDPYIKYQPLIPSIA
jgi:hypothetical protein